MINSLAFGPVPSRRLGRSLGINNIPPKTCSYSCIYCQIGKTSRMLAERSFFFEPGEITNCVKEKIEQAIQQGESIDYLTFVPDGEPTLDVNLGAEIEFLKSFGTRIAVVTNASLIWREDVRQDLKKADWVSLKVDAVNEELWRRIDRPQKTASIKKILDGMQAFRDSFGGCLTTESMLLRSVNDRIEEINAVAEFLGRLKPDIAYLAIPTRPPAERAVIPASEKTINIAYQVFRQMLDKVECLLGYEGNAFAFTGDVEKDLLGITAVHPMREDGVTSLLEKAGASWDTVESLIKDGKLTEVDYLGKRYYIRKLKPSSG